MISEHHTPPYRSEGERQSLNRLLIEEGVEEYEAQKDARLDEPASDGGQEIPEENWKQDFERLLFFLEESETIPDPEKLEAFKETEDPVDRLRLLRKMSLTEAIECIRRYSKDDQSYPYLKRQLARYQKMVAVAAARDNEPNAPEEAVDTRITTPHTLMTGILRDLFFAAMMGTPEMAIVKIATNEVKEHHAQEGSRSRGSFRNAFHPKSFENSVTLKGYYSGIFGGRQSETGNQDVGLGLYPHLRGIYRFAKEEVRKELEQKGKGEWEESRVEHKAIMRAADRLAKAVEYNRGSLAISDSSYSASFEEAMIASSLGEQVMKQMQGMRKSISGTDLHNIARFLGKSGDCPEETRLREIKWATEHIRMSGQHEAHLEDYQKREAEKAARSFRKSAEIQKNQWLKKRKRIIESGLSEEETSQKLAELDSDYESARAAEKDRFDHHIDYLASLDYQGLLDNLTAEKENLLGIDTGVFFSRISQISEEIKECERLESELGRTWDSRISDLDASLSTLRSEGYSETPGKGETYYQKENAKQISYLESQFEAEQRERLSAWLIQVGEIRKQTKNPKADRKEEEDSITSRYLQEIKDLRAAYDERIAALRNRTREDYIEELSSLRNGCCETRDQERYDLNNQIAEKDALIDEQVRHIRTLRSGEVATRNRFYLHKKASLAQKALDLHFLFNGYDKQQETQPDHAGAIDWINDAPFGLIKWAHHAISKGVSEKEVLAYSFARFAFSETPVTRQLMSSVQGLDLAGHSLNALRAVQKTLSEFGIEPTPENTISLVSYPNSVLRTRLKQGYTKEALLNFQWLKDESLPEDEIFPFDKPRNIQEAWIAKYAYAVPEGWRRRGFGGLILNRLNQGVDSTLHDATFWLHEFAVPDQKNGVEYRNKNTELALLYALTRVPDEVRFQIPTNPNRYNVLFSSAARLDLWEQMLAKFKAGSVSGEEIRDIAENLIEETTKRPEGIAKKGVSLDGYKQDIEEAVEAISEMASQAQEAHKIPELVSNLRGAAENRKRATDEAYSWFAAHSQTPHALLTFAWNNRESALADGCEDNPNAIKQWADLNGIKSAYGQMERSGTLPPGFTSQDLDKMNTWTEELIRCYDGETVINELARIKEKLNLDFLITPLRIDLGEGWTGEVLRKDDPRGLTIGHDTGCCMTVGGVSHSCINAGYEKPPYGFFALYRDKRLVAQSFLYTNQDQEDKALVCDNIEANQGRDMVQVLERYRQFFGEYLQAQLRRNFGSHLTRVQIGIGHSDVGLDDCPETDSVSMPDAGIYTDAEKQRLLYSMPPETENKCKRFKTEIFTPSQEWDSVRDDILLIEQAAFPAGSYSEGHLRSEFTDPEGIAVLLRHKEDVVGYCTGFPVSRQGKKVVYVSSTAIMPPFQKQGLVGDLMYLFEIEAGKRGYEILTRNAMVENGYADALERNYEIIERGLDSQTPVGKQRFLAMKIPPRPQSKLLNSGYEAKTQGKLAITPLSKEDAGLIAKMERECYPEAALQGKDFYEGIFDQEEKIRRDIGRSDLRFSFLARKDGKPAGYVIVLPEDSEINHGEVVAHIQDIAVLPTFRGSEVARELFDHVIEMAGQYKEDAQAAGTEMHFSGAIEMEARASTSYKLLMNPRIQSWLGKKGYAMTHTKEMPQYLGGEDYYYVRLEETKRRGSRGLSIGNMFDVDDNIPQDEEETQ